MAASGAHPPADWRSAARPSRWTSAAIVVALHVVLVVGLLRFDSVRNAVTRAAPIMTTLITPPREKPREPPAPPPPARREVRPKPQPVPQPAPPATIVTAPPEAQQPAYTVTQPPPVPVASVEAPVAVAPAAAPEPPPAPVTPPRNPAYLNNPRPTYPIESLQMGEEGTVILRVFVNERGLPEQVQVRTSSGFGRLDRAAQDTVLRQYKFEPARHGDKAVGAWVLVPLTFRVSR